MRSKVRSQVRSFVRNIQVETIRGACSWEQLEPRLHLCAEHAAAATLQVDHLTSDEVARLNALPFGSPAPFDLHNDARFDIPAEGFQPREANSTTILDNGPSSNRIDLVLVGDGYTEADLPTYHAHALNAANSFFNQPPLNVYKPLFNVHRVDVISNQSGVDHDPTFGIQRDTALDMEFWCFGIERLLCINPAKAHSFAVNAPQVDQILAVANSTKYGGAGYASARLGTFSGGNGAALEIALHEFGHAFADLADEYDYVDGATYFGPEPPELNVSAMTAAQIAASQTKWHRWLDHAQVDAFEGAKYHQFGLYRPTVNSKMRSLGRPWDPVNTEQLIIKIYEQVRPIDDATPPGSYPNNVPMMVDPVDLAGGQILRTQWFVDGTIVPNAIFPIFDPTNLNLSGTHTLTARVWDATPLVRDPAARETLMTETRSWTLFDVIPPRPTASSFDVDRPAMEARFTFSEDVAATLSAGDLVLENLTTGATVPANHVALSYDPATRTARFTFPGYAHGVLPDGSYRATIPAGAVTDASGNALAEDVRLEFGFVQADATRDGRVNLDDFNLVAANFGQSDRTFTQGDFNYDTITNLDDFNILISRFGTGLGVSAAPANSASMFGAAPAGLPPEHDRADDAETLEDVALA